MMGVAALLMIDSGLVTDSIGIALIAVSFAIQTIRLRKEQRLAKA